MKKPIAWSIASSDSGGGAGIQADLLTMHDLNVHACQVVSTVTAQNSLCIDMVEPISETTFLAQLETLLTDFPPQAIKIGFIADEHVNSLALWLHKIKHRPYVVLDPVLAATSGDQLTTMTRLLHRFDVLFPYIDCITPNADELAIVSGLTPKSIEERIQCAEQLLARGANSVWIKGGHFDNDHNQCIDIYHTTERTEYFYSDRLPSNNTHGSGCTLSAALASFVAHNYDTFDAITLTKAYLTKSLRFGTRSGHGEGSLARTGWPVSSKEFPWIPFYQTHNALNNKQSPNFLPLEKFNIGCYPIVHSVEQLTHLLSLNLTTSITHIQLRIKGTIQSSDIPLIRQAIEQTKSLNIHLWMNDHWEIAIELGMYGVHLGQDDLQIADLQAIAQAGLRLGISTHGYFELTRTIALKPSYIALGHIFPTTTKQMPSQPQGLQRLQNYTQWIDRQIPTVAIGGITLDNAHSVINTGVDGIAFVRPIQNKDHTENVLSCFSACWEKHYAY